MTRYLRRLVPLGGLVAAAVVAFSAGPAGATIVCQPGHTPPPGGGTGPYCTNVKPTAVTGAASAVKGTSATLNGAAGARVAGGDPTQWFFKYGTSTAYGKQTPTQTLGTCPPGRGYPYCTTPATQGVAANVSGLTPCTTYHFQIFANNPDTLGLGPVPGGDKTFKTGFSKPIKNFKTPAKVKHHKKFTVKFTLNFNAKAVKIFIKRKNGSILTTYDYGSMKAGNHSKTIKAPKKKGQYTIELHVKLSCGSQSVKNKLKVN
jgi:hypothetical protein